MWNMHSYDYWNDYLNGGRKKYVRPLYDFGMVIEKVNRWQLANTGDLQIKAKWAGNTPFIIIHNDDSYTIQGSILNTYYGSNWQILNSQGVRYRIWKYTGINVFVKNGKLRVLEGNPALTPTKIQGCRSCSKTGRVTSWCSPPTCYSIVDNAEGNKVCSVHSNITLDSNYWRNWHYTQCEHGLEDGHEVKRGRECSSCSGTGKRDYGNKPISLPWDGSPLRIKDRKIVTVNPLTQVTTPAMSDLERMVREYAG